jgi:hypothetical protein
VLFGSRQDWEAIVIDINRNNAEPESMSFEVSNYTSDKSSFHLLNTNSFHLRVKMSKQDEKTWSHQVFQKNGDNKSSAVRDPFAQTSHPSLAFVLWNGSLDVEEMVKRRGYGVPGHHPTYELPDAPLSFLDIDTYCSEGIDLRAAWIDLRKQGQCVLRMPARKPGVLATVNLLGGRVAQSSGGR